ncbi:MAG TPA: methionine--tRNA ligase [Clostridia bacterium]|nr:methionine--tRNA ligase [Clostridia bacterium]
MAEKFYITTPIYYPSGKWHIGTCYTTVICDAIARFKRMQGFDVFYLTGTDEHGQKIEQSAKEHGLSPKEWVDIQSENLKKLWKLYGISYDKFIRTTDEDHEKAVSKIFQKLYDSGDIYKSEYEGWYCVPCESFWTESQLKDGKCPDCGRDVTLTKESSYFFRLSKYTDRILKLFEENPEFLEPKTRQNEMINSFLKPGLQDLAVSRTSFKWGIPVPFDNDHVIYVWIDALTNYITALGYLADDDSNFKKYWPADIHMMAKEIVRFHSIIWPSILMGLGLPLPKRVYGHGWLMLGGDKISKSKGNIVDPVELASRFGVDAIRYYLLREVPFGQDGLYTNELLIKRINIDLANMLGNLVSRTSAMVVQYFDGVLPSKGTKGEFDEELISITENAYAKVAKKMDELNIPDALQEIFEIVSCANKYIDQTTPWALNKNSDKDRLGTVLYNLCEAIRVIAVLLKPFMIDAPNKIFEAFSISEKLQGFDSIQKFGAEISGSKVVKSPVLFQRIDIEKELKSMEEYAIAEHAKTEVTKKMENSSDSAKEKINVVDIAEITIDDFKKIELKVGLVVKAEKVEKADKLLKLTVEIGDEIRTIASSIAEYYTAEEITNKQVVVVTNLKPAKFRGIESQGMLLCAINDKDLCLVAPIKKMPSGSVVC